MGEKRRIEKFLTRGGSTKKTGASKKAATTLWDDPVPPSPNKPGWKKLGGNPKWGQPVGTPPGVRNRRPRVRTGPEPTNVPQPRRFPLGAPQRL